MTTRCRHSQQRRAFDTNLLGLCVAMALATPAILTTPSPATAAPITYTLSGVTATFPGNQVDTLTGTFVYDPVTIALSSAAITVTGPVDPDTYNMPRSGVTNVFLPIGNTVFNPLAFVELDLHFGSPLTATFSDALTAINFVPLQGTTFDSVSVTGTAVPATPAVPEPTSLALLGGALGLFFLRRRAGRRHIVGPSA